MFVYTQLVIGRGTSALGFLHYAREAGTFTASNTMVIGRTDLWTNVAQKDPEHRFGQPAQIVSVGATPGHGQTVEKPEFQTAKSISSGLENLEASLRKDSRLSFVDAEVTRVVRGGIGFIADFSPPVKTGGGQSVSQVTATRVIVATGFGPSSLPPVTLPKELLDVDGNWRKQVMGGTEYLYSEVKVPTHDEFTVAVHGSSATSSWAVLRALALGAKRIVWVSRSGFADANPAGRNSDVLREASAKGWLVIGNVSKVATKGERLELTLSKGAARDDASPKKLSTLAQAYKQWYAENQKSAASNRQKDLNLNVSRIEADKTIEVDHYVYALGADPKLPGGAQAILGEALTAEMEPVFDVDKRFGDVAADTTVAMCSPRRDLWLVGAAVFRSLGKRGDDKLAIGDNFKSVAQMMCEAGTPPEGIAAVLASLKAVTGFYEDTAINLQTADFQELERWAGKLYQSRTKRPAPQRTVRMIADQVVALRKHTVFGLTKEEVDRLSDPANAFWDEMFATDSKGQYLIDQLAEA